MDDCRRDICTGLISCEGDWKKLASNAGVSEDDINNLLNYSAQFLGNAGNYKSFGDSKFIPRISSDKIAALAKTSLEAEKLYKSFKDDLYESKSTARMHFGYPAKGHMSTYYPDSPEIMQDEIEYISNFLKERNLMPENTRLRQTSSGYELLIASAVTEPTTRDIKDDEYTLDGPLKGKKLHIVYGDHRTEMAKIAQNLTEAKKYALNDEEAAMQADYIKAFHDGSMQAHKNSQRHWIKDKGPMVESNIGFIETYRDPSGERGEWEGFASMVNKERTKAFGKLVESAPKQIPKLPWPSEFEKDKFLAPDFTSLEVLTFAGSVSVMSKSHVWYPLIDILCTLGHPWWYQHPQLRCVISNLFCHPIHILAKVVPSHFIFAYPSSPKPTGNDVNFQMTCDRMKDSRTFRSAMS